MNLLPSVYHKNNTLEDFEPKLIYNSLLKETSITPKNANIVCDLATRRIVNSKFKFLSGPHIREIVNAVLGELGFDKEREEYTRIGICMFDLKGILKLEGADEVICKHMREEYQAVKELIDRREE